MQSKGAEQMKNYVDSDQTAVRQSELDLHCLLSKHCSVKEDPTILHNVLYKCINPRLV